MPEPISWEPNRQNSFSDLRRRFGGHPNFWKRLKDMQENPQLSKLRKIFEKLPIINLHKAKTCTDCLEMSKRCFWFETSEKSYCFDLGNVFLFLVKPQKRTGYYFVTISINSVNVTLALLTGDGSHDWREREVVRNRSISGYRKYVEINRLNRTP